VQAVPAQQLLGPRWQAGSADTIYQSLNLIDRDQLDLVVVAGADHVYRMDPAQMIGQHTARGAGVTVAALPVPRVQAAGFGVVHTAPGGHRIEAFWEKPADPPGRPGHPGQTLASMGIYVFTTDVLVDALAKDAADEGSRHSIGGDIIPMLVRERAAYVYDFRQNEIPGVGPCDRGYWRDVGTIDSYFAAHMDLCAAYLAFNLYNDRWPILTHVPAQPPTKFVYNDGDPVARAVNSVISNGVIISGGAVHNSVLSPGTRIDDWSQVDRAVILHNARVGRHAVVQDAIVDNNVTVLEGATVGMDKQRDRARGLAVSRGGITVAGHGQVVPP
jgi:glucose-1-phosphate adenylyltransferase